MWFSLILLRLLPRSLVYILEISFHKTKRKEKKRKQEKNERDRGRQRERGREREKERKGKRKEKKCRQLSSAFEIIHNSSVMPFRLLCPWDFPGKNTGVGCNFLLQGIFPIQGLKPGLRPCRQILYHLSYREDPVITSSGLKLRFLFLEYNLFGKEIEN